SAVGQLRGGRHVIDVDGGLELGEPAVLVDDPGHDRVVARAVVQGEGGRVRRACAGVGDPGQHAIDDKSVVQAGGAVGGADIAAAGQRHAERTAFVDRGGGGEGGGGRHVVDVDG